jgi:hypothetical protein
VTKSAIELDREADDLERQALGLRREAASQRGRDRAEAQRKAADIPVDRNARTLADGSPVTDDHREIDPKSGMQRGYVVLSAEERARGFVRPVRTSYVHSKCGGTTTMSREIAETYARDPYFYSGTFCTYCRAHFPVGEDGEFTWLGESTKVGT